MHFLAVEKGGKEATDWWNFPQISTEGSEERNIHLLLDCDKVMNAAPPEPAQITPELLVDALSGHEDGLLAIAERLMLSYDSGYDAMGEAIIDAFADVQRLFQHVVEAAHMEGAAFESTRSRNEWRERAERVERERGVRILDDLGLGGGGEEEADKTNNSDGLSQGNPPHRHEELIDQDVRDVLLSAIKKSEGLMRANKHEECRALYERTCHSASALLPVDSDHRGRLQLATARAESMSPDRSCAILRYAMDDVLRSGLSLREGRYKDERERRGDCVLRRVDPLMGGKESGDRELNRKGSRSFELSETGSIGHNSLSNALDITTTTVEQSADEALASLVEEMKEILQAPVYATTPLLSVSDKFWMALTEAKKSQNRRMERLEQMLAKIKADFLLAREVGVCDHSQFSIAFCSHAHVFVTLNTGVGRSTFKRTRKDGGNQEKIQRPQTTI
jgi:hypothetical protein